VGGAGDADPVGELVVVGVGVVEETALLDEKSPRVGAGAVPAVPAKRPAPGRADERLDRTPNVLPLLCLGQLEVLDPPPAVAADVVPCVDDRARDRGVPFEGEGTGEDGDREVPFGE
jgi:hypothetical protein